MSRASTEERQAREAMSKAIRFLQPSALITMLDYAIDYMNKSQIEDMAKQIDTTLDQIIWMNDL